jgi:isoleucyl-tRNA synthetase
MNEILEVLVRLMAPILSFTADEIWQYMKGKNRTVSVHADLFAPVNDLYEDKDLADRWDDILKVRKEVTKALELSRKEKTIGHSLDALVTLGLSSKLMERLTPYKDQLRSVFIVSAVDMKEIEGVGDIAESETVPGLKIRITPSEDTKCERCWVHDPTVGEDGGHPGICRRCLDALAEMEIVEV